VNARQFCTPGHAELLKQGVHEVVRGAAGACLGYSVAAFLYRRDWHLAVNAAVYLAVVSYETKKVRHHREARCAR
jgi:hypothetical protein